ncbi:tetratricopeptide repeat protein [bacterium]|nr:tetratricopeptide repeat protein [bacterium]
MRSTQSTFGDLFYIALIICAVLSILVAIGSDAAVSGEIIPADLLQRWHKVRAESPDSGKVANYLDEGERIIERLQELDNLRRDPNKPLGSAFYQRIESLQNKFKDLLFRIEVARITSLPPEKIASIQADYEAERRKLQEEIVALEDSIIARSEHFLNTYKQQIALKHYMSKQEMIVDFIYRLAEIYYRRGEDLFFQTNNISAFQPSLEYYQMIIDEFPASEYVDDALYNIAYVKNSSLVDKDKNEAITLYKTIITKYATSPFVPEAYWRVGEYYFYQRPPQTALAISFYSHLQDFPETNWYARSLYKIGWCHFMDANYPDAIDFFTQTVEVSLDSARGESDPLHATMLDEALEYVSVCFAQDSSEWEDGGVQAAVAFVEGDSKRRDTYGNRILEYLGDIFKAQVGRYWEGIEAYKAFLALYPMDPQAPWVQEKIIESYYTNLREFGAAYDEKNELFVTYKPETAWREVNSDPEIQQEADIIIEKYYFQNINETIGRALNTSDAALFASSVAMSRAYLETYPIGPNAYTVNFNLAVMLDQHVGDKLAAYTEYIKVSSEYDDEAHQKESAVNAVIIAQQLVQGQIDVPMDSLVGTEVSEIEQKYVDAIDNYVVLFPDGEEAEIFMLNAGSIYYNHGLHETSREYYNRLLTDFPTGAKRGAAYQYIMNGYFAEGNYVDAERIAKEIQEVAIDSMLVSTAKTRQSESAFLYAEGLKGSGDLLSAAEQYKRTALENPGYNFADKAFFESGLAYQEGKAWPEANEVYLMLVDNYPESELADKALYNVGYNAQSELNDPQTAAATFERLAAGYPNSELAQDALRNSSINYVEAEDWQGAVRVNGAYVVAFPLAADANLFLFENAGLFLKLGDEASANQIYADYATNYPDDPRTVRARWERGQYLQDQGRRDESIPEFIAGIEAHRLLVAKGAQGEETYASRCLFEVIQYDYDVYASIDFAPASAIASQKERKLQQRDRLLEHLEEVNKLAKDEMFEGLYMVGKVEEELSETFANQALPQGQRAEEKILTQEVANSDAIEISVRSIEAYIKGAEDIRTAANVISATQTEIEEHKAVLSNWLIAAQKAEVKPEGLTDSTTVLAGLDRSLSDLQKAADNARDWERRAKEKVPELAMRNSNYKYATVQAFLDLPDVGRTEELRMLYRSGVLSEFAAPRGVVMIQLNREAIQRASYSENPESWKQQALEGVSQLFNTMDSEYRTLNERALQEYTRNYRIYEDLLQQGEAATTSGGLEAADIAEQLVLNSDFSYELAITALNVQNALLEPAGEGEEIPSEMLSRYVASAIEEVFRVNNRYHQLITESNDSRVYALERQDESVVWEDAVMTFEDCAYNYTLHQEELLTTAMEFNRLQGNDRATALRIGWALVDIDREAYLSMLADYGEERWINSDDSFLITQFYEPNWSSKDFAASGWESPRVTEGPLIGDAFTHAQAIWVSLAADSLVEDTVYVRRHIEIAEVPVGGELWISADGGYMVQLNGEYIGASEAGEGWSEPTVYDIAQILKSGHNALAVMVMDPDRTTEGLKVALKYKVLPTQPTGGP